MIETEVLVDGKLYSNYREAEEAEKIYQIKMGKREQLLNAHEKWNIDNLISNEIAKMLIGKDSEIKLCSEGKHQHQNQKSLTFCVDNVLFAMSDFMVQKESKSSL